MARRSAKEMGGDLEEPLVRGAPLKPIRYVERELTRPDGTKLRAKVPVYPPFRLEDRPAPPAEPEGRKRPDARPQAPGRKKAS